MKNADKRNHVVKRCTNESTCCFLFSFRLSILIHTEIYSIQLNKSPLKLGCRRMNETERGKEKHINEKYLRTTVSFMDFPCLHHKWAAQKFLFRSIRSLPLSSFSAYHILLFSHVYSSFLRYFFFIATDTMVLYVLRQKC